MAAAIHDIVVVRLTTTARVQHPARQIHPLKSRVGGNVHHHSRSCIRSRARYRSSHRFALHSRSSLRSKSNSLFIYFGNHHYYRANYAWNRAAHVCVSHVTLLATFELSAAEHSFIRVFHLCLRPYFRIPTLFFFDLILDVKLFFKFVLSFL